MKKAILHAFCSIMLGLILGLCPMTTMATHIVGGEMNYRCLGNNEYEISLTIFRDCDTGVPWFDNPAAIGVFNGLTNAYLFNANINLSPINDTLDIYLPDSCLIVPNNVCIHTTTYTDTITLPPSLSGYTIAYQRCCRNHDILNIQFPEDAGATYWINISPAALQVCNSSAVFNNWPRVYLCSGVPIAFDHSATDADGDSLVYELCTPYHGASDANPAPTIPNAPPYPNINWLPPYSTSDMFGNPADPLTIDPVTGLLTGTPVNLGVFLVGVCIKEYRNGNLISTTHRDFQHVVGTCAPMTVAHFDTSGLQCNKSLTFPFQNQSQVVTGTYNWLFDTLGASTAVNPTYTFPDTGLYTVTLIAGIGSPCLDTFSLDMNLQITASEISVTAPQSACQGDSVWLVASDLYAAYSDSTVYTWSPDSAIVSGQGTDSVLVIASQTTNFYVGGLNNWGCFSGAVTLIDVPEITAAFDTATTPCNTNLQMYFTNTSTSNPVNNHFQWYFGGAGPFILTNPNYIFPDTGDYTIQLIAGGNTACPDTFLMDISMPLSAMSLSNIPSQTVCQGDSVWIKANDIYKNYSNSATYTWTPSSAIAAGQGTDSVLIVADSALSLSVSGTNSHGCSSSTNLTIDVVAVAAAFDTLNLACNTSLSIPFVNASSTNLLNNSYLWAFDSLGTSVDANPVFTFPDTGTYTITLIAGVGSLCPDTALLDLYLPLYGVDLVNIPPQMLCVGDSVWLKVSDLLENYSSSIQYTWTPAASILAGQGTDSVLISPTGTTTIQVAAINNHLCLDSTMTTIDVMQVEAAFDTVSLFCNTSLAVPFVNTSTSNPFDSSYQWIFDNLGTSTAENPTYTFPDTGTYTIRLIAGAGGQCPDTTEMDVYLPLHGLDISANDVQVICKEDTVLLLVSNSLAAYTDFTTYQWSPANAIISGQGSDSAYALMDTNTTFTVIGVNAHGCIDTAEAQGTILYSSPSLTITATPDSIFVGQASQLVATYDINYNPYEWLPDTTLSAYDINDPEARPRQTTTYYLTVTNEFGCQTTDSVIVKIRRPICGLPVVFVPSAFTPDGDGHNDVLMINGNNIDKVNMAIYNRWGQKVFETNDQNYGWDGTFKGKALAPDVYGYYMQCTCDDGSDMFIKGNITLLR